MRSLATTILAATLVLLLQGCDSVLDNAEPSVAVPQDVVLSTPAAIDALRASMYDRMHTEELSTDWLLGPSALADNTFFRSNQGRHQELNLNQPRAGIITLEGRSGYDELYGIINDANLLINAIEEGVLEPDEQNKITAEALFMRALALHHLVRVFGYDPNGEGGLVQPNSGDGASFNLGVVIRTTPTLALEDIELKERSPVLEVYDQIINDLTAAIGQFDGLPAEVQEGSEFFPSKAAAEGLLARVHLYARNWGDAETRAQNAIDDAAARFGSALAAPEALSDIFDETNSNPEAIFTIDTDPVLESAGVNEAISAYTSIQWIAQLPTQDLMSLYEEEDARRGAWYAPCFDEANDSEPSGCELINDEGFELQKYISEQGVGQFADDYIHLRIAEMYLIQAEARLNLVGVEAAINRLNDLRAQRGASALDPGSFTFDSAYDEILNERRRELVAEGHRFFDLKRLGRDIAKPMGLASIPFNDRRILDDLPTGNLEVNTLLEQNPGY